MKKSRWMVLVAYSSTLGAIIGAQQAVAPPKGGEEVSGAYEVVTDWPQPISEELTWGRTSSVFAESPNRVFVLQSGMLPQSWRQLEGERRVGAIKSGPGWGEYLRRTDDATHCGSSRAQLTTWKGTKQQFDPWYCRTRPDGSIIDELVDFYTGEPIPGARWEHIVTIFNREGKLIDSWEQHNHLFSHPHFITISPYDPNKHVWIVDSGSDQVFKFTRALFK